MSASRTCLELLTALLLCACGQGVMALDSNRTIEQYTRTVWSSREYFPGGAVNVIAQTPDGYLWIGGEKGLVRFDGISFRLFDHASNPSLPEGHVLGLIADSEGALWVRMESPHLLRYFRGAFKQAYPLDLTAPGATAMAPAHDRGVILAPADGPVRYKAGKVAPVAASGDAGGLVMSVAETSDGTVWTGMRDSGLIAIRGGRVSHLSGLPDQKVNVLLPGPGGELWIGTDGGLVRWTGSAITRVGIPGPLARSQILALARDRDSNLWISTATGIARIAANGAAMPITTVACPGTVRAIFEDREGNLWIGGTEGLVQLREAAFLSYAGVATDGATVHVDPSRRTWIGPAGGGLLWIQGTERGRIREAGLDRDIVYSISSGPGELWIGRRLGLTHLREDGGVFRARTYTAAEGLAPGAVYAVHSSRDGAVWAGTLSGGVSRLQKGRITTFTTADGVSSDAVTTIAETRDGAVWIGTSAGLQSFRSGHWRRYGGEDGLPPGRVNSLTTDPEQRLWIATSAGLFYWSGKNIEAPRNTPELLRGGILGLAPDTAGKLWVTTERRLVALSRAALLGGSKVPAVVREFGPADGLPSTLGIRRDHSVTKDPGGRIWFSLQGGLGVVDPSRLGELAPALVHVESVAVDGSPLRIDTAIRYSSDRRRVVFSFVGVSLAVPGRVRYRYRLDGYDADWSPPTESREAAWTNLSPGTYTFRVMASNSEGLWNGDAAVVPFQVDPQFWQTWWFRLATLSFLAVAIVSFYRYRMLGLRAAMNLRFEERLAERTRIAQELHDTLLQGFLSASMQVHVATDLLPESSASRPLLTRSLELMQQVIEEGRNAVRGLRTSSTTIAPLETALSQVKEEVGAHEDVDFRVVVEGDRRELHPVVRDEVYRIGREALINAFRHAHARHIEVELNYAPNGFKLFVRDDGVGITEQTLRTGRDGHWGLVGIRERAERVGGRVHVFSRPSAGTEFELDLPSKVAFRATSRK